MNLLEWFAVCGVHATKEATSFRSAYKLKSISLSLFPFLLSFSMDSDFWTSRLAAAKRQLNLQQNHSYNHQTSQLVDRLSIDDFEVEEEVRPDFPCPYCYEDFDIASLCSHLEEEHSCESRVTVGVASMADKTREWHLWRTRRGRSKMAWEVIRLRDGITSAYRGMILDRKVWRSRIRVESYLVVSLTCWINIYLFRMPSIAVCCKSFPVILSNPGEVSLTLKHVQRRRRLRKVAIPSSQALSLLGRDLREAHLQVLLGGSGYRSSTATSTTAAAANDPFLSSLVLNYPTFEAEEISKSVLSSVEDSTTKSVTSQHIWKLSFDPSLSAEEREKRIRQATGRAVFVQDLFASSLLAD
ncbi:hypothetical protein MTR67_009365 [Solanum verrucosum]|uniref:Protein dehydration-induced 19 C-terminal domain-containing protein n=1 Tax=Solanum verrucosum TaxID=315347 RepID=A0AAF0Q5J1_SOLVR|nr:hypothetical protein MTR67_009365 [Solanum verrucosum]